MASSGIQQIVNGNNKFALSLYKELAKKDSDKNVFFSPLSLTAALALTHVGAKNNTSEEIKHLLDVKSINNDDFHSSLSKLFTLTQNEKAVENIIKISNCLFSNNNHPFLSSFIKDAKTHFNAEIENMDFNNKAEECRQKINDIVKDKTNDMIKDFLKPGSINPMTAAIIINAIYFKGVWSEQFKKEDTRKDAFIIDENNEIEVDMMYINKKFKMGYSEEIRSQVLELPYVKNKFSMIIVLPFEDSSLKEIEPLLSFDSLNEVIENLEGGMKIDVNLPKFKIEYDSGLKDIFVNLGMNDVFQPGLADFSGMDGLRQMYVSEILHKARIEVNEEGTVAAAATGMMMFAMCMPPQFLVNRPFLFLIRDNESKLILFMGRVMNPNK